MYAACVWVQVEARAGQELSTAVSCRPWVLGVSPGPPSLQLLWLTLYTYGGRHPAAWYNF